jgi:hypothetical protein
LDIWTLIASALPFAGRIFGNNRALQKNSIEKVTTTILGRLPKNKEISAEDLMRALNGLEVQKLDLYAWKRIRIKVEPKTTPTR